MTSAEEIVIDQAN